MEDVIPDSGSLVLPLNLSPRVGGGAKAEEAHQEANGGEDKQVDAEKASMNGGDEEKGDGLINHLISIVSPRGTPKAEEVPKRKVEFEVEDDIGNEGFSDKSKSKQDVGSGSENNGGGVISNLISNFFNQSDGGGEVDEVDKEAEKVMKDIGNKRMKMVEEEGEVEGGGGGGGGGAIIDNSVSHLPTSRPAPLTDEDSILITSVVRD